METDIIQELKIEDSKKDTTVYDNKKEMINSITKTKTVEIYDSEKEIIKDTKKDNNIDVVIKQESEISKDTGQETAVVADTIRKREKKQSDFSEVTHMLLNSDYKRRKTILNDAQVTLITTLDVIAQIYDIPFLKNWVDWFAEWKTSGSGGIGRKDIVEISKFHYAEQQRHQDELLSALRGK